MADVPAVVATSNGVSEKVIEEAPGVKVTATMSLCDDVLMRGPPVLRSSMLEIFPYSVRDEQLKEFFASFDSNMYALLFSPLPAEQY